MSTDEVLALVGKPVAQAELHPYKAWRYEYDEWRSADEDKECHIGGDFPSPCPQVQVCAHTTVWFNDNEVRSMTSIHVDNMEECGLDSTPIFWEHMPEYVKEPAG